MSFESRRAALVMKEDVRPELSRISHSATEAVRRVERAKVLLSYAAGVTVSATALQLNVSRQKVDRCVRKVLAIGVARSPWVTCRERDMWV